MGTETVLALLPHERNRNLVGIGKIFILGLLGTMGTAGGVLFLVRATTGGVANVASLADNPYMSGVDDVFDLLDPEPIETKLVRIFGSVMLTLFSLICIGKGIQELGKMRSLWRGEAQ